MESFSSSQSSLASLKAQLEAFARELDRTYLLSIKSAVSHPHSRESDTLEFFKQQEARIKHAERGLFAVSEDFIPGESSTSSESQKQLSASELAHLLTMFSKIQGEQMRRLEQLMILETSASTCDHGSVTTNGYNSMKTAYSADFGEEEKKSNDSNEKNRSSTLVVDAPAPLSSVAVVTPKNIHEQQQQLLEDPPARHWSVGYRLDTLAEADNETDGTITTTPGSHALSRTTPTTNTSSSTFLFGLEHLSAHTNKTQQHADFSRPLLQQQQPLGRLYSSEIICSGEMDQNRLQSNGHIFRPGPDDYEDDSDGHDDYDEHAFEDRILTTEKKTVPKMIATEARRSSGNKPYYVVDEDDDDDSANYCATVVACDRNIKRNQLSLQQQQQQSQRDTRMTSDMLSEGAMHYDLTKAPSSPDSCDRPHFSFIHIDKTASSPAPTNLTIDTSMYLSNTFHTDDGEDKSRDSDETPVLDRYRIDVDDKSPHGFRVVPNERGVGRRQTLTKNQKEHKFGSSNAAMVASNSLDVDLLFAPSASPLTIPSTTTRFGPSVTSFAPQRPLQIQKFKKLSSKYKRQAGSMSNSSPLMTPTIDENAPLCYLDDDDDDSSVIPTPGHVDMVKSTTYKNHSHTTELPLLTSSKDSSHQNQLIRDSELTIQQNNANDRSSSLPPSLVYAKPQVTFSQKFSRKNQRLPVFISSPYSIDNKIISPAAPTKASSSVNLSPPSLRFIHPISVKEYRDAPRIVRMQVSSEDVERAVEAINQHLATRSKDSSTTGLSAVSQFKEREAKLMLTPLGYSDRKCKAVLMSLCHWKRLLMSKQFVGVNGGSASSDNSDHTLVFDLL